jgi:hypothetical protein
MRLFVGTGISRLHSGSFGRVGLADGVGSSFADAKAFFHNALKII